MERADAIQFVQDNKDCTDFRFMKNLKKPNTYEKVIITLMCTPEKIWNNEFIFRADQLIEEVKS